jgi:hypothetical protein
MEVMKGTERLPGSKERDRWNARTGHEILSLSLAEDPAKLVRIVAGDKALLTVSVSGILRT